MDPRPGIEVLASHSIPSHDERKERKRKREKNFAYEYVE